MPTLPDVRTDNIDEFEKQLDESLRFATPEQISEGVVKAAQYIEDLNDRTPTRYGDPDPTHHVNNATSTFCRVTRILLARIAEQQRQ